MQKQLHGATAVGPARRCDLDLAAVVMSFHALAVAAILPNIMICRLLLAHVVV